MQKLEKRHKKDTKTIKDALKEQTAINSRLVDLLEAYDQGTQPERATSLPQVLIDLPYVKVFDKKKQEYIERQRQYSKELFIWLIENYRSRLNLPALEKSQMESRFEHCQAIATEIAERCKRKHGLDKQVQWGDVKDFYNEMYKQLEHEASPYMPLKSCTRRWGSRLLLSKSFQNAATTNNKQTKNMAHANNNLTATAYNPSDENELANENDASTQNNSISGQELTFQGNNQTPTINSNYIDEEGPNNEIDIHTQDNSSHHARTNNQIDTQHKRLSSGEFFCDILLEITYVIC